MLKRNEITSTFYAQGPPAPGQGNYRPSGQVFPSPHGAPQQGYHGYPPNQQGQPPAGQVMNSLTFYLESTDLE